MASSDVKVFYVNGVPAQASARYRVFNALEQLRLAGIEGTLLPLDYDPLHSFDSVEGPGVLVIHRAPWDERLAALMKQARERGFKVLYDIDDLVFDPVAIPWVRGLARLSESELELYEDGVRRYHRALRAADGVLTTTMALAKVAAAEGVPAFVHRNALDLRSLDTAKAARKERQPREEDIIYYGAGTATHDIDFYECSAAIERVLRENKSACLLVQGDLELPFGLQQLGSQVRRWRFMPWPDYFLGIAQADINIAPVELGNPFCEVKSELKWFESAALGIPTIASATEAFSEVIKPGETGFLARSESDWYEALQEMLDRSRRQAVGAAAHTDAMARSHPMVMAPLLKDLLTRVAASADLTALAAELPDRAVAPRDDVPPKPENKRVALSARPKISVGWLATAFPKGGGGARNIMRMARHLQSFGHDVTLYIEPLGHYRTEKELISSIDANFGGDRVPVVMGLENTRPSDALIATFWLTAYYLRDIQHVREKFYLVQDYEPFFYPMGEEYLRAEATYHFGFHHITSGPWCAKYLKEQFEARADHFDFPLDRTVYYPRAPRRGSRPRVIFFSRPEMARRCFKLGIDALARLKARLPDVDITLFGSDEVETRSLPFSCENVKNVGDLNALAELYSSADAALVLSTTNTSLLPFEVAACGCPVVDLDLDVNRVNYRGGDAMMLAAPDPDAIAEALYSLLDDAELHEQHREAGLRLTQTFPNEEQAARRVEEILLQGLGMLSAQSSSSLSSLNGYGGPLDHLALDVTCRQEDSEPAKLVPGRSVTQSFRVSAPNLAAVAVKVALFGAQNPASLEMSLYEEDSDKALQTIRTSLLDVQDNSWAVFRFAPLADSAGKQYRFVISSPDSTDGPTAALHCSQASIYDEGRLQLNGKASRGSLVFQTFVEREDVARLEGILQPQRAKAFPGGLSTLSEGDDSSGGASTELVRLREELRLVRKQLKRLDSRSADALNRLSDLHNFFGAVRGSLPYRAARKVARTVRLARR
jgi:glycosyltransferase involved in cell wall biosynthesis